MEKQTLDRAHFISFIRNGGKLKVEAEDGFHTVEGHQETGYYLVDGKSKHTLEGIYTWFGFYHAEYAAGVVEGYSL